MKVNKFLAVFLIPAVFFLISLFTLKDYGVNWDEPIHFIRGQAYLTYFLTGKTNFQKLSDRPSYFQNTSLDAAYYLKEDSGHPPLNGILAAFSNLIFYQKLNLLNDIDSYHLFNILAGTFMVVVVTFFAYESLGGVAAIISGLALATYPLFFSESHFNIKDPPEAAFFAASILFFWLSLKKFEWKWLIFSAAAFAFSFSMKFNILFLPFIVFPYLIVKYWGSFKKTFSKIPKSYYFGIVASILLIAVIFVGSWPFLWADPVNNFLKIFLYYKGIGTGAANFPGYVFHGFDLYPIFWIITTTPPLVLLLCGLGIAGTFLYWKKSDKTAFLWLMWFLLPILRVTLPGATIYGGVRQIFEYIPAMALLAGYGAKIICDIANKKYKILAGLVLVVLFIPHILGLINLHPNQNVYFNRIVGGLPGAVAKNIPNWGNSYGNAYWQAVSWMNLNSEKDSELALVQGTGLNIPTTQLRPDIKFSNGYWTASFRGGEYLMELTFNSGINPYPHAWEYVNKVLEPVYEVKADGVPIAKVWKNDLAHTRPEYRKPETQLWNYYLQKDKNNLLVTFNGQEIITRFFLHYVPDKSCSGVAGQIQTSIDGKNWSTEPELIPNIQVSVKDLPKNTSPFFFAMRDVKFLRIIALDPNSCLLKWPSIEFWGLK